MVRMTESSNIRASAETKGYLDSLRETRTFGRAIDGFAFAAAYALKNRAEIDRSSLRNRTDLAQVSILDDEVRLALESAVIVTLKRRQMPLPADGSAMIDIVSRYAEMGVAMLKERWEGKTSLQIQHDIRRLMST